MASRPDLILHAPSPYTWPDEILENRAHIESLPIDGMGVLIHETWGAMMPDGVADRDKIREQLQPLKEFNEGMDTYLTIFNNRPGDLFDDAAWAHAADNWQVLGEEAKAAGFKGIFYDNEEYGDTPYWQNFPDDHPGATPDQLGMYQDQASKRGEQMMEALAEGFPDGEVGVFFGPWRSTEWKGETSWELLGPFFTGMMAGRGPDQTLADMGEQYTLRTEEGFAGSAEGRSKILPEKVTWNVPDELRENYDAEVVQDFMVYTGSPPGSGLGMDPETLAEVLGYAFDYVEDNVYLYSDWPLHDWFKPGDVSREWIEAVESALAEADRAADGEQKGGGEDASEGDGGEADAPDDGSAAEASPPEPAAFGPGAAAVLSLGGAAEAATVVVSDLLDVSGNTASMMVQPLLEGEVVGEAQRIRLPEQDDAQAFEVAAGGAAFDAIRVADGEGDLTGMAAIGADDILV